MSHDTFFSCQLSVSIEYFQVLPHSSHFVEIHQFQYIEEKKNVWFQDTKLRYDLKIIHA